MGRVDGVNVVLVATILSGGTDRVDTILGDAVASGPDRFDDVTGTALT